MHAKHIQLPTKSHGLAGLKSVKSVCMDAKLLIVTHVTSVKQVC